MPNTPDDKEQTDAYVLHIPGNMKTLYAGEGYHAASGNCAPPTPSGTFPCQEICSNYKSIAARFFEHHLDERRGDLGATRWSNAAGVAPCRLCFGRIVGAECVDFGDPSADLLVLHLAAYVASATGSHVALDWPRTWQGILILLRDALPDLHAVRCPISDLLPTPGHMQADGYRILDVLEPSCVQGYTTDN